MKKERKYYLREWRLARDMTQDRVSEIAVLRRATVNDLERGKHEMKPETLESICAALQITERQLRTDPLAKYKLKAVKA